MLSGWNYKHGYAESGNVLFPPQVAKSKLKPSKGTILAPGPWSGYARDVKRLNKFDPSDQHKMMDIKTKSWVLIDKKDGFYYQLDPTEDVFDQVNPRKYQYVVRVEDDGPYTEIMKNRKVVGIKKHEYGENIKYTSLKHNLLNRFSRASKLTKCAIITGLLLGIGAIIAGVVTPIVLHQQCKAGTRTGQVCSDLLVEQTVEVKVATTGHDETGEHATTAVMCDDHTCANGGTCHLKEGKLDCKCVEGYTGARCEQKMNERTTQPTKATEGSIISTLIIDETKNTEEAMDGTKNTEETKNTDRFKTVSGKRKPGKKQRNGNAWYGILVAILAGITLVVLIAFFAKKATDSKRRTSITSTPSKRRSSTRTGAAKKRKTSK